MEELITIYKMDDIKIDTRINLLIKVGDLINYKYASNVTEPVVIELIKLLNPDYDFSKHGNLKMFLEIDSLE